MKFLLLEYMAKNKISSLAELERLTGLNKSTLHRRINHPEELRVFEIRALDEVLHFSAEDLIALICDDLDNVLPRAAERTA